MRQSNVASPQQNQACLLITSRLYDRRGLDCTSPLPLFNSLAHLTHLTATSPKIREILTRDGGLERLVRLLRDFCAAPPPAQNPAHFYGLLPTNPAHPRLPPAPGHDREAAFRFSLAFQCVVNIGVRGSEPIRSRVVQAGTLDVVGSLLEAWLTSKGFPLGPPRRGPKRPKDHHHHHSGSNGAAIAGTGAINNAIATSRDRSATILARPQRTDPVLGQATTTTPRPRSGTLTRVTPPASDISDDRSGGSGTNTETESDADVDGEMEIDGPSATATQPANPQPAALLPPPTTAPRPPVDIIFQDDAAMDVDVMAAINLVIADGGVGDAFDTATLGGAQQNTGAEDVMPTPRATLANLVPPATADDAHPTAPASPSAVPPPPSPAVQAVGANNHTIQPPNGNTPHVRAAAPSPPAAPTAVPAMQVPIQVPPQYMPPPPDSGPYRQEDVLRALQLLAYLTKYPHVRQEFYKPRPYPPGSTTAYGPPPTTSAQAGPSTVRSFPFAPAPAADANNNSQPSTDPQQQQQPTHTTLFSLVERFTFRPSQAAAAAMAAANPSQPIPTIPNEIQSWAAVIMRNACRKDDSRGGVRQCANMLCGRWETVPREFAKCRRCRKAKYCGKECQSRAWAMGHRYWCSAREGEDGEHESSTAVGNTGSGGMTDGGPDTDGNSQSGAGSAHPGASITTERMERRERRAAQAAAAAAAAAEQQLQQQQPAMATAGPSGVLVPPTDPVQRRPAHPAPHHVHIHHGHHAPVVPSPVPNTAAPQTPSRAFVTARHPRDGPPAEGAPAAGLATWRARGNPVSGVHHHHHHHGSSTTSGTTPAAPTAIPPVTTPPRSGLPPHRRLWNSILTGPSLATQSSPLANLGFHLTGRLGSSQASNNASTSAAAASTTSGGTVARGQNVAPPNPRDLDSIFRPIPSTSTEPVYSPGRDQQAQASRPLARQPLPQPAPTTSPSRSETTTAPRPDPQQQSANNRFEIFLSTTDLPSMVNSNLNLNLRHGIPAPVAPASSPTPSVGRISPVTSSLLSSGVDSANSSSSSVGRRSVGGGDVLLEASTRNLLVDVDVDMG